MTERKVVNRNVAIGIGALCIILLVALIAAISYYTSTINSKNSQIASLQSDVGFDSSTINRLEPIVNLTSSTVWVDNESINQPAGNTSSTYTSWSFLITYAGYVVVNVLSSTNPNTYVELEYSWNGVSYDNTTNVGSVGLASFPVLPANNIAVRVINDNLAIGASETVTITYWY
jgi:hypothetical protein